MSKNSPDASRGGDKQSCECPEQGQPKTWAFFSAPKNEVDVIAHRGGNGEWPGETKVAFENAEKIGVDVLELDVRGTWDKHPALILVHWKWLRRTTQSYRFLPWCALEYIQKLNAAFQWTPDKGRTFPYREQEPPIPIALLKDVLERFGHMKMVIEIKQRSPSIVKPVLELIDKTEGLRERVLIASFSTEVIKEVRKESKSEGKGEIATSMSSWETLRFYVQTHLLKGKYLPPAAAIQLKGRFWYTRKWMLTKAFVERAQCLGYRVQGWTIDDADDMRRAIDAGVDGIITDFPTRLIAVRNEEEGQKLLKDARNYTAPEEFCDVVMKGGLTSGVVYPLAICELARHYSFKNIGGTSAGAIGAAAAAAAEYHRRTKPVQEDSRPDEDDRTPGFAGLAKLPKWLSGEGNVAHLFQPNPLTAPIFRVLTTSLGLSGGWIKKISVVLVSLLRNFPGWTLPGVLVGLLFVSPILFRIGRAWAYGNQSAQTTMLLLGWVVLLALPTCLVLSTAFALIGVVRKVRSIPDNFYGLTTGLTDPEGNEPRPALTTWLADTIDAIAGKERRSNPLTFGDLRGAHNDMDQDLLKDDSGSHGINLQMMTTNVTLGRPYRFPFDDKSKEYFYRPDEWKHFFPAYVMEYLKLRGDELSKIDSEGSERRSDGYELLPEPNLLPVVIAARMSLSFPFLISPVPLWTIDRSKKNSANPERCLFSDGGIASNFPLHFFDQTLPRWPTFAFSLKPFHQDYPRDEKDESKNSYLVQTTRAGLADNWDRFEDKAPGFGKLSGFIGALINTVYNWADNAQARVPGYRDRVVHIFQTDEEGGMNLNMPRETVMRLSERGRLAGVKLRERFTGADGSQLSWDHHRWTRYRSMMSLLEKAFQSFKRAYDWQHDTPSYKELIARDRGVPPKSYDFGTEQRQYAIDRTDELAKLATKWQNEQVRTGQTFTKGEPNPVPELRMRPRI